MSASSLADSAVVSQSIGRGTLYSIAARFAFLVSSYVIHISLAYMVTPLEYGNFGVVLAVVTVSRVLFSTGLPQTTSTLVARDEVKGRGVWSAASRMQLVLAATVTGVYIVGIPIWAQALGDQYLHDLLLLAAPMIPLMAWYQINLSYLNGRLWFGLQSLAAAGYALLRVVLALGIVALGFGIAGAIGGLTVALLAVAIFTRLQIPARDGADPVAWGRLLSFSWPLMLFSLGSALLVNLDLLMLKHFHPNAAFIGYYSAAANLGKAPYFVLSSFAVTLLPAAAMASARDGLDGARKVVTQSLTRLLLVAAPSITLISMTSSQLIDLVYRSEFAVASRALSTLAWSMSGLAALVVIASGLTGLGRPRDGMFVVLGCTAFQAALGAHFVPRFEMLGAAVASAAAVTAGVVATSLLAYRRLGAIIDVRRSAKIVAATVAMAGVAWALRPSEPWLLMPLYVLCGVLYSGILLVTGGLTKRELVAALEMIALRPLASVWSRRRRREGPAQGRSR